MKILVINAGSSSLKFQLLEPETKTVLAKGNAERIGDENSFIRYKANGREILIDEYLSNHKKALEIILNTLTSHENGVIHDISQIGAFGHRVVNVGEDYFDSIIVTPEILEDFKHKVDFSPLHVPAAISGIEACMEVAPEVKNVAVFDIGFHKTLPEYAYRYAIPKEDYTELKIRRYGAHGTSHKYVSQECAKLMERPISELKIITCHLGSGGSITAVKGGQSVDTSMGFTPLEGIMMGTRAGDIDPAVVSYLCHKREMTVDQVINRLNKQSGFLGVSQTSNDMRDILANLSNPDVQLSMDIYNYRIKKYIGAYAAAMGGVDAIVFTAGIGEYTPEVREGSLQGLEFMGIKLDKHKNITAPRGEQVKISADDSAVDIYIIPTDEELVIAQETEKLVK